MVPTEEEEPMPQVVAEPVRNSEESQRLRRQKAEAAELEARAKVTDLMNLLEDKSTTDDW